MNVFEAARLIVASYKLEYPGCESAKNIGGGVSSSDFSRKGSSSMTANAVLQPPWLSSLIQQLAPTANRPSAALSNQQDSTLSALMGRTTGSIPGFSTAQGYASLSPTGFSGQGALETLINRNPFSSGYENATAASFKQRGSDVLAQAATGQDAVRGGDARTGIAQGVLSSRLAQERGREVRDAQMQDAGLQTQGASLFNMIESNRRGQALGAQGQVANQHFATDRGLLGAAGTVDQQRASNLGSLVQLANLLAGRSSTQTDNFSGEGFQAGGQASFNPCCFNFVVASDGQLPAWFERAKIDHYTPARRRGYFKMGERLVPLMATKPLAKTLTYWLLVKPFISYGNALYDGGRLGRIFKPYCHLWLRLWGFIGR